MTYKAAVAGVNLGGGKSVIVGDNKRKDREALFRAHGRFIETLGGRYIRAEDVGTSPADMEFIRLETNHVAGLMGMSGDPSPITAYGVYMGMKATAHAPTLVEFFKGDRSKPVGSKLPTRKQQDHVKEAHARQSNAQTSSTSGRHVALRDPLVEGDA